MTGDTPGGGSEVDAGGPGWGIRQPRPRPDSIPHSDRSAAPLPPDHLTPLSAAPPLSATPPPPPQSLPAQAPAPRPRGSMPHSLPPLPPLPRPGSEVPGGGRRRNTLLFAVIGAVVLFGGAGGAAVLLSGGHTGTAPPSTAGGVIEHGNTADGKTVLTSAVNHFEGTSARADITMTQSYSATGPGGEEFGSLDGDVTFQIHIDQQSATRSEMRETVTTYGVRQVIIGVQYDDTIYLSTDNGASYQTTTIDRANAKQVSPQSPLAFFTMLGDVTHTGAVEVNGLTAASYHAVIDPVKLGNYLKQDMAGTNDPDLAKLADNLGVTDASFDAAVDPNGNLISETGVFDTAMDMGVLDPSLQGASMNMKVQVNGAFSDYGAPISIAKPGHVTGAATI
ncbi:MAG: hypothetical protein JOZ75_12350 [Candidatus Dormibacteraeota bacterium]|nr:hypothetical protein [Candidatus Dormibacteraeota bacterium]